MDLLAGYEDDVENSQTSEIQSPSFAAIPSKDGDIGNEAPTAANLESEWENFEKMLADSTFASGDATTTGSTDKQSVESVKTSDTDPDVKGIPKAYAVSRSRSKSKSRSRSNSSRSSDSSRSSSADSQKGKKGKRSSSSSSDEVTITKDGSDVNKLPDTQDKQEKSPVIERQKRSPTPVEKDKSKSRSKSKSPSRTRPRRHRSRSKSRNRHGHSSRRHRRSRSRGHDKHSSHSSRPKHHRSRSRDRHRQGHRRKSDSRDRNRDKRSRHERRRRSRSRGRDHRHSSPKRDHGRHRDDHGPTFRGPEPAKPSFKDKMRQQLMKASKLLTEQAQAGQIPMDGDRPLESPKEKPSSLPLNATSGYPMATNSSTVTPQIALLQTMAVMHQKAQEMTGIAVPKYYNPAAVNPLKYAEQVQKRKLLWSKNKEKKEDTQAVWQGTNFNADSDGKVNAKFRKLMGMKEGEGETEGGDSHCTSGEAGDINQKQQELFHRLDQQYEFARMTTHTHRGIGLGFQSQGLPDT